MTGMPPRAVAVDEPFVADDGRDYADAFAIRVSRPDERTAEQWGRAGLEPAPATTSAAGSQAACDGQMTGSGR